MDLSDHLVSSTYAAQGRYNRGPSTTQLGERYGTAAAAAAAQGFMNPVADAQAVEAEIAFFVSWLGGGCGARCTDAARTEQIYEAAADNMLQLVIHGYLTPEEATLGMQAMIAAANQAESRFGTTQATNGAKNATSVIKNEITSIHAQALVPLTGSTSGASQLYLKPGKHGWYTDSLAEAANLTDGVLQRAVARRPVFQPTVKHALISGVQDGSFRTSIPARLSPGTKVAGGLVALALIAKLAGIL